MTAVAKSRTSLAQPKPKASKKKAAQKSKHSAKSPDYGTPEYICDSSRVVFGGPIDLDPCSSPLFNQVVRALKIYTRLDNGLAHPWLGNIQVNPPGEDHGDAVKRFGSTYSASTPPGGSSPQSG